MRLVDLSNTVGPHWKWGAELKALTSLADGDFSALSLLTVTTRDYTHVDAPAHMFPDGPTLDQIDTDQFWGPAAVLDLQDVPRASLITRDLLAERGAHLAEGDIALLCTGLASEIPNTSPEFWAASPYLDRDAAQWLVDRGAKPQSVDRPAW
jgi:arylformamidase